MMLETLSGIDIEFVASFLLEAVCLARLEVICALVFLFGWYYGKFGKRKQKATFTKHGFKQASHQGGKAWPKAEKKSVKKTESLKSVPLDAGRIERTDPKLLKDPAWVVPQVTQLCNFRLEDALLLYRTAVKAGLAVPDVPAEDARSLFVALVFATLRAGKTEEAMELLSDLRQCGLAVSTGAFASVVKLCTSKQLFLECLQVMDDMSKDSTFIIEDKSVWSCLLFCATETKAYQKCNAFFERLKACGAPSNKDVGNMMRIAALHGDWEGSLSLIKEMCNMSMEIDSLQYNTTLATCVAAGKVDQARALLDAMEGLPGAVDVITYNTIMKGYAKAGRITECFELFGRIQSKGISASQVTYGILLDCCINEGQLDRAMTVFNDMSAAGCPMNTVLYTTLIKGCARAGELEKAMDMYKKMSSEQNISPDLITFSILIKANCDNDRLEEALKLLEGMFSFGLRPDEVVFNNLMAGCARHGNAMLGKQLYEDMVKSGVRPSNATFSILIRLYHQCKLLDEAITLLKKEPTKHNVDPEPRLFLQLIQSCIRERQGKRGIEVYRMLAERSKPTVATHSSILSTCMRINMYDTAAEIISIAAASGARVDVSDCTSLLDAANKKGKTQVMRSVVASMRTFGHAVDSKFVDFNAEA